MYSDSENYDWAGNLVVHQLKQDENGELHPVPIDNVIEKIKKDTKIKLIEYTKTINKNKNTYKFSGKNYEFAKFDAINGISKIKGKINLNSDSGKFGFMFNVDEDNLGSLNIVFDIDLKISKKHINPTMAMINGKEYVLYDGEKSIFDNILNKKRYKVIIN